MKSNGFGRFEQRIIIDVPHHHSARVETKLNATPVAVRAGDPMRTYLEWSRHSIRRGYDEDIVFYLSMLLEDGENQIDWQVDWEASDY